MVRMVTDGIRQRNYFHGQISLERVTERLNHQREGSFLIRESISGDILISFVDFSRNLRHVQVPKSKSHSILKLNPHLLTQEQTLDHILHKKFSDLSYPVIRPDCPGREPAELNQRDDGFICSVCSSCHPTKRRLSNHKDATHKLLECERCTQIIFPHRFVHHKNSCVPDRTPILRCQEQLSPTQPCSFHTTSRTLMKRHEAVHAKNIFKCLHCPKSFPDEEKLQTHNRNKHGQHYRVKCDHCERTFGSQRARTYHMENQHIKIADTVFFKCTLCAFHCDSSFDMQVHMADHRRKFKGPFICQNCKTTFKNNGSLRDHIKKKRCENKEVIDEDCIDEILGSVIISTSKVQKVLKPIIKKNGPKSAPRNLKKKISVKMNSFNYEIEAEILDDDENLFTRSVFTYPKDVISMTEKLIEGRGVLDAKLSVGYDVGM